MGFQKHAETVKLKGYTSACHFSGVNHTKIAGVAPAWRYACRRTEVVLDCGLGGSEALLIDMSTDPTAFPPISLFEKLEDAA
ncbi:hypothetical protein MesoLj131c_65910 (plasmid) [Mesorhizobium sp. 131-3-5]|nr:hypothetical protein MesoLj131c_65910 [Mesorhizobium sp. 131-3-5]